MTERSGVTVERRGGAVYPDPDHDQGGALPAPWHRPLVQGVGRGLMLLTDMLMPPRCLACGEIVDRQGSLCPACWANMTFLGLPACARCGTPFEFDLAPGAVCASCAQFPPPFTWARSALAYDEGSRGLVLRLKHDALAGVPAYGRWLARAAKDKLGPGWVLTPVPLHRFRLWTRRYNQSALLAASVARSAGLTWTPDLLRRVRATPSQAGRNRDQRASNMRGAFAVSAKNSQTVRGARVIVVDDVFTTGATVGECARALLAVGAAEVGVLTLARVIRAAF